MTLRTFDFKQTTCTFGTIILDDFFEGSSVAFEANSDLWLLSKNVGGGGTRSKSNDASGRMTFSIDQASPINDQLMAYVTLDKVSNAGVAPFMLRDVNNDVILFAENAWIVKYPSMSFAQSVNGFEWIIESENWAISMS